MSKSTGTSKAKADCWKMFSKYIRVKGCFETTGTDYLGICITCGTRYHITYLEAGHCFSGRSNGLLLNEKLVNNQCRYCNQVLHGKPKKYRKIMDKKYGAERVERWKWLMKKPCVNVKWADRRLRYHEKLKKLYLKYN